MSPPRVYKAINAVAAELARNGIPKADTHKVEGYQYRSVDDVLNRLSPLLAKHRLCVLPRALERVSVELSNPGGSALSSVTLKIAYDLVSAHDGSAHTIEAFGEALDDGDKATGKAMSSAYKTAMLQTFCIPVVGLDDADASTLKLGKMDHEPAPVQGWDQWAEDIQEMIGSCASSEALERVQNRHRGLLKSISRERPSLYRAIGVAFTNSRFLLAGLNEPPPSPPERAISTSVSPTPSAFADAVTGNE